MVIIDPYRGGSDFGYVSNNIKEKDFNLMISKYINNRLNELGINSILTRNDDTNLSDVERANIINKYDGLAISNRLNYGDENGVEIVYSLKNTNVIPNKLETGFNDRDIFVNKVYQKRDNDTSKDLDDLLKNANTETIIINYGYINNNDDINNVINNYERYAESVVKAIADYYGVNYSKNLDNEYIVKKGDSLYSIANRYNTTVDNLKKINNLKSNLINVGQVLKISNNESNKNYYIVKKGDTLYSIAKNNNTSVNELKQLNNLSSNILAIGQKLLVPNTNSYIVKKGDSLWSISKMFNTTVDDIKRKNNLSSNIININQVLLI